MRGSPVTHMPDTLYSSSADMSTSRMAAMTPLLPIICRPTEREEASDQRDISQSSDAVLRLPWVTDQCGGHATTQADTPAQVFAAAVRG